MLIGVILMSLHVNLHLKHCLESQNRLRGEGKLQRQEKNMFSERRQGGIKYLRFAMLASIYFVKDCLRKF